MWSSMQSLEFEGKLSIKFQDAPPPGALAPGSPPPGQAGHPPAPDQDYQESVKNAVRDQLNLHAQANVLRQENTLSLLSRG